jgi:hypothetical protein
VFPGVVPIAVRLDDQPRVGIGKIASSNEAVLVKDLELRDSAGESGGAQEATEASLECGLRDGIVAVAAIQELAQYRRPSYAPAPSDPNRRPKCPHIGDASMQGIVERPFQPHSS